MNSIIDINWPRLTNVLAATTSRQGGISLPPFDSFNLGDHVADNIEHVQLNRQRLSQQFNSKQPIQWLNQVHGGDVVEVTIHQQTPITADAAFTKSKNITLAILTADCLPILLVNQQGDEIAAVHGGWKPLAANIIANTLDKFSCKGTSVKAWLGPCIGSSTFEVGAEVKAKFLSLDVKLENCFIEQGNDKYLADLQAIARYLLTCNCVNSIDALAECTLTQADKYFSYRRDGKTGRMASLISIQA
ncbi:peptidoglycan editing factor PgeF [Thalassomonas sp. M1454]|uniref:peptidoglycan editing factor PgeF n=1 Tax=Thalassomonas sp. M1454 TaxID=2594477 RepID=UPI00117CAE69|nr:peptidoglycan editing factor PgeF [Thalassomonas sp. M1454]TRX54408.1 peptidoglycan editing factor PgeF [Thalassomonas sp. M1454]